MEWFDFEDSLERIDPGAFSLLLVLGTVVGAALVELSVRGFRRATARYAGRIPHCGLSGRLVAERLLTAYGLSDVRVVRGAKLDGYHPVRREVRLTTATYDTPSLCSLAAAAHEVGHAQQFADGMLRARLRQIFWPLCYALPCLALLGWLVCLTPVSLPAGTIGAWLPAAFVVVVLLQLPITLPLERDASARARRMLQEQSLIAADELPAFDEVLDAAWRTHAASEGRRGIVLIMLVAAAVCFPSIFAQLDGESDAAYVFDEAALAEPSLDAAGGVLPNAGLFAAMFAPLFPMAGTMALLVAGLVLVSKAERWMKQPRLTAAERALERNNAGNALQMQQQFAAAIEAYEEALALDPGLTAAHFNRANAWAGLGRFEEALADLDSVLHLAPQYADALLARGYLRLARGEHDAAIADLDEALRIDAENASAWSARGDLWMAREQFGRAIEDYSEAIHREPESAEVLGKRGLARVFQGDFHGAIADLSETLRINPDNCLAYNNRGVAFLKLGEYARAAADLSDAIRLEPDLPNPYRHLAWLQATCPEPGFRDGPQAVTHATRALELSEWKPTEWLDVLAAAHAEAGEFQAAVEWQQKAIDAASPERQAELCSRLELYRSGQPFRERVPARSPV